MQIAFVVDDMTMLRYYVPLSLRIYDYDCSVEQTFFLRLDNHKYNGLALLANKNRCDEILSVYCGYASVSYDSSSRYDIVFQVESGSRLECKKRISIQHGFDYVGRLDTLKSNVDLYVCSMIETAAAPAAAGINCVVPPLPISVWNVPNISTFNDKKTVLVFYPDQGENELAIELVNRLEARNLNVLIKQRKKHQAIAAAGKHIYDELWYPCEAIILPASTAATIGFGSSAYTDLVPLGVRYINIDIRSNEPPWNAFKHPVSSNYTRITDKESVVSKIVDMDYEKDMALNVVSNSDIETFIKDLLEV